MKFSKSTSRLVALTAATLGLALPAAAAPVEMIVNGSFGTATSASMESWTTVGTAGTRLNTDAINTSSAGNGGLNDFFGTPTSKTTSSCTRTDRYGTCTRYEQVTSTTSTNAFAVLGDSSGVVGGDTLGGIHAIYQEFTLYAESNSSDLQVSFDWALNSQNARPNGGDALFAVFSWVEGSWSRISNVASGPTDVLTKASELFKYENVENGLYRITFALNEETTCSNWFIFCTNPWNSGAGIDNVSVLASAVPSAVRDSEVPEPGSLALMALGLLGIAAAARRRKM